MERRETASQDNLRFPRGLRNRTPHQIQCLDQFHGLLSATFLFNNSLRQHDRPSVRLLKSSSQLFYIRLYSPAKAQSIVACPQCRVGVLLTSQGE